MNLITALSTFATAFGLAGAIPQIARMWRARSAGGQSPVGWGMGAVTNMVMCYVNAFGYGATVLAAGNVVSTVLCLTAMATIAVMRNTAADETEIQQDMGSTFAVPLDESGERPCAVSLSELPTSEFRALTAALATAQEIRAPQPCTA